MKWDRRIFTDVYWLACSQFTTEAACNSFENCNYTAYSNFLFLNFSFLNHCEGIKKGDIDIYHADPNIYKVNVSAYGFPHVNQSSIDVNNTDFYSKYPSKGFCENIPGLDDIYTCQKFGCIWSNINQGMSNNRIITFDTKGISIGAVNNVLTIWDTIKFIITFNFDIGWGDFNWIISALFYILNICLIVGIYFTFVPG